MSGSYWQNIPRRPRYAVNDAGPIEVHIERLDREPRAIVGQLADFSRQGAQVYVRTPMMKEENIILHLENNSTGVNLNRRALVRWIRQVDEDTWAFGCQFAEDVPFELLGELFLNRVLTTDEI